MLKRDLIKLLESMPDDAVVVVNAGKNSLANDRPVSGVDLIQQHALNTGFLVLTWSINHFPEFEQDQSYLYRQAINIHS